MEFLNWLGWILVVFGVIAQVNVGVEWVNPKPSKWKSKSERREKAWKEFLKTFKLSIPMISFGILIVLLV